MLSGIMISREEIETRLTGAELRIRNGTCEVLDWAKKVEHTMGYDPTMLHFSTS